ncbi:MAG TPA: hypothetical protein VHA76_06025 [Solirubrobacterales bacterium]|nr:hypothetical protein [Solirubrobacterales bacterium]
MNPNQMMIAKAMVAQEALRDEARRSREARRSPRRRKRTRTDDARAKGHGILDIFGLALSGRR